MTERVPAPADLAALTGRDLASACETAVDQAAVDRFVAASGDRQWIHSDPVRAAAELPGGRTIVPGNLLLSLVPAFLQGAYAVERFERSVLAGYGRVRFRTPVPTGARLTATARILSVTPRGRQVRVETLCRVGLAETGDTAFTAEVVDLYFGEGP